jgi:hypothetical protein
MGLQLIIEPKYGYEGTQQAQQSQSDLQKTIQELLQVGINQWKYQQALKMAKEPCRMDPQRCGYYISQAMKALGLNPPSTVQNLTYQQAQQLGAAITQYPYPAPQEQSQDNTLKYLLLAGGVVAGIFLIKYNKL